MAEVVAATRIMRKIIMLSHKLVLLSNIQAFTCLCPTVVCKESNKKFAVSVLCCKFLIHFTKDIVRIDSSANAKDEPSFEQEEKPDLSGAEA